MAFGLLAVVVAIYGTLFHTMSQYHGRFADYQGGGDYEGVHPSVSPDGNQIVYSSPRTGQGDLYLVDLAGKNQRRLTTSIEYDGDPTWSRDGNWIAFVRETKGTGHIWLMSSSRRNQHQITFGEDYDCDPSFSPTGDKILFTRKRAGLKAWFSDLWMLNLTNGHCVKVIDTAHQGIFSPGGREIYYQGHEPFEIRGMVLSTHVERSIGPGDEASVSPDGRQFVYLAGDHNQQLWTMNANGSNRKLLLSSLSNKTHPTFTPDGKQIVFLDLSSNSHVGDLCLIRTNGGNPRSITSAE